MYQYCMFNCFKSIDIDIRNTCTILSTCKTSKRYFNLILIYLLFSNIVILTNVKKSFFVKIITLKKIHN